MRVRPSRSRICPRFSCCFFLGRCVRERVTRAQRWVAVASRASHFLSRILLHSYSRHLLLSCVFKVHGCLSIENKMWWNTEFTTSQRFGACTVTSDTFYDCFGLCRKCKICQSPLKAQVMLLHHS